MLALKTSPVRHLSSAMRRMLAPRSTWRNVICGNVPVFALKRESGDQTKVAGPSSTYRVATFSHGLHYRDLGDPGNIEDVFDASPLSDLPPPVPSDILALPPMDTWVNVRALGRWRRHYRRHCCAQKAIAEHKTLYFPAGQYRVTDTLALKPDTVMIGLHPSVTRIILADDTPAFQGVGDPKPLSTRRPAAQISSPASAFIPMASIHAPSPPSGARVRIH